MISDSPLTPRQQRLAREARERIGRGEKLNAHQREAFTKLRYQLELQEAVAWLTKLPFDEWVEWSGRSEAEVRQGLALLGVPIHPLDGVNAIEVIRAFHEYLDRCDGRGRRSTTSGCTPRL